VSKRAKDLPPLYPRHIRRPRLTRLIDEATARCVLLVAPAGYGKTTLAREWAQGRENVYWYQATPASADVAAFSVGLAEALAPVAPEAVPRLKERIASMTAPAHEVHVLAETLAAGLNAPHEGWVVIDDYQHLKRSPACESFVDTFVQLARLRYLVTTRRRPSWASTRRLLHGEINEISHSALAMSPAEARRLLSPHPPAAIRELVDRAEGWPVVLALAANSTTMDPEDLRISDTLFSYFAEEVLQHESAEVQDFTLRVSVLPYVDAHLVRSVLRCPDPESALQPLLDAGLIHLASDGHFVLHPLLRTFLRARLLQLDEQTFTTVARAAITELRAQHRWQEAFHLATQMDARELAAEIVGDAADDLLSSGQIETLERWLCQCGSAVTDHAPAALARVSIHLRAGRFAAAAGARAVTETQQAESPYLARAWNLAGRAFHLESRYVEAFECYEQARTAATDDESLKDALWGLYIVTREGEFTPNPDDAKKYMDVLAAVVPTTLVDRLRFANAAMTTAVHGRSLTGLWPQVSGLLEDAIYASDSHAAGSFLLTASYIAVLRADYVNAIALTGRIQTYCIARGLGFVLAHVLNPVAGSRLGIRDFPAATRAIRALEAAASSSADPFLAGQREILATRLALCTRTPEDALASLNPNIPRLPKALRGELYALASLAAAAYGDLALSKSYAAHAAGQTDGLETVHYIALARTIRALRSDRVARGRAAARAAVRAAMRAEVGDLFVTAYRAYPPLLDVLHDESELLQLGIEVLGRAHDHALARSQGVTLPLTARPPFAGLEALTPRETDVLRLLCSGFTNREIARALFISSGTAKVHVQHVLTKLRVKSRVEAVIRARDLGFPP
jgi:LuxR family maltose regulon positive regulatory protein